MHKLDERPSPYKGVILAAGKGQRLRPLTDHRPKPLLPFGGIPILVLAQWQLKQLGIQQVIVNAHYQWEKVVTALGRNPLDLQLSLSLEQKEILGTGGAFARMHSLREGAPLVALNGDVVSDFPLADLVACHEAVNAQATMALLPNPHPGETKIWSDGGRVVAIGGEQPPHAAPHATPHGFACMQVLSDGFLAAITLEEEASIIPFYEQAIARGETIAACIHDAFWFDLGNPSAYYRAHAALLAWWDRQPFDLDFDPLGLCALYKHCNIPLHFVGSKLEGSQPEADQPRLIGPCLVPQNLQLPPGSCLGPFAYVDPKALLPETKPVIAHHCLLMEGAQVTGGDASYCDLIAAFNEVIALPSLPAPSGNAISGNAISGNAISGKPSLS